jgi:hypothetical protein
MKRQAWELDRLGAGSLHLSETMASADSGIGRADAPCPRCGRRSVDALRCWCCPHCGHCWAPPPPPYDGPDVRHGRDGGGR